MKEQKKETINLKEQRIGRINKIRNMIIKVSNAGKKTSYKKIIAGFCLDEGLSKRTIKEYVDLLIDSEQVKKEGDELSFNKI